MTERNRCNVGGVPLKGESTTSVIIIRDQGRRMQKERGKVRNGNFE